MRLRANWRAPTRVRSRPCTRRVCRPAASANCCRSSSSIATLTRKLTRRLRKVTEAAWYRARARCPAGADSGARERRPLFRGGADTGSARSPPRPARPLESGSPSSCRWRNSIGWRANSSGSRRACRRKMAGRARQPARGHKRAAVWAVEARVARRAASVRSAIAAAGAVYAPEQLHVVRIALKKLRYSVELASEGRHKHTSGRSRRAQSRAGAARAASRSRDAAWPTCARRRRRCQPPT